ncbi:YbaK/EbsC family protein [Ruficoccus amylovorans]|uniref:YbaK/EbsC family protein n=1 Tax=Ruficoccus amylovorans TaxID=1804625 RepID=A0A842HL77_9BACT|nr:YbaK/EbsC family protein [Ruficoccus amylovorans]MBC2596276.1 YbaK/EbsC family protein [Ruficoccus amylovorans]
MCIKKLREYLDRHGVKYVSVSHSPAYSAQEVAASVHVSGRELAKVVMVTMHNQLAMVVLPASYHIDFQRLNQALHSKEMYLASEEEFVRRFPDCEPGAMPPFGNLYGMEVFVAQSLSEDSTITFNAGTHTDAISMAYTDFARLVEPRVISFTDRVRCGDERREPAPL